MDRQENIETIAAELWDAYSAAKSALWEQEKRVFEALQKMADAILEEQITDADEIDEILLEIYAFGDQYGPALNLFKKMCMHIRQKNPVFGRMESAIVRAIFKGNDGLDSEENQ